MTYQVAEHIDLVRDVASGLPDDEYVAGWHDRPDDLGPSDDDGFVPLDEADMAAQAVALQALDEMNDDFATSVYDPNTGQWLDA